MNLEDAKRMLEALDNVEDGYKAVKEENDALRAALKASLRYTEALITQVRDGKHPLLFDEHDALYREMWRKLRIAFPELPPTVVPPAAGLPRGR